MNVDNPSPYRICPGEESNFEGASSFSNGSSELVEWRWDWNGDGTIDETTDNAYTTHVYEDAGSLWVLIEWIEKNKLIQESKSLFKFPEKTGMYSSEKLNFKINEKILLIGHGDGLGKGDTGYKFLKGIFKNIRFKK